MKGRIIGPPNVVMVSSYMNQSVSTPVAHLAVAIELDSHVYVPALLAEDVYPLGTEVTVKKDDFSGLGFKYFIVKGWHDTGSLVYIDTPDPLPERVTGYKD